MNNAQRRSLILEHRKVFVSYTKYMHDRRKNGYDGEGVRERKFRIRMGEIEEKVGMNQEELLKLILDEYLSGYR